MKILKIIITLVVVGAFAAFTFVKLRNNKNELKGLWLLPKSLKPSTLARIMNAILGNPKGLLTPKISANFNP